MSAILAIDQGTTSSRAIVFAADRTVLAVAQQEFAQHFPASGWVEHDPEDIWRTVVETCRQAIAAAGVAPADIAGIGITNQRETTIVWERDSGRAIHNAIVWQDRRTGETCRRLAGEFDEGELARRSGLLFDPYFSATKIAWILDHVDGARAAANDGKLAFGTVETFLLWRLTGGRAHLTDATNASRTALMNLATGEWDDDLLDLFQVPRQVLPRIVDCAGEFAATDPDLFAAAIPVLGMAGDQQAAALGQACFAPGMMKSTYGTGCFALINTGEEQVTSSNRLLTTVACQLAGRRTFALEGSIFIAGSGVQWLRDGLGVIDDAAASGSLAASADDRQDVILVPAFVGLGAPYWRSDVRGGLFGLTRATGPAELARATLEAVCFQTCDLMRAMAADWPGLAGDAVIRVDGGMSNSAWTMQRLADLTGRAVERPASAETTALGAAWLAAHRAGVWPGEDAFAAAWRAEHRFDPAMDKSERDRRLGLWRAGVDALIGYADKT